MLFSSIPFLFYFLPCVLLAYTLTPKKFKNLTLLICSLVFYAWGEPRLVILMMLTVFCGYVLGLLTEKYAKYKKLFLAISLVIGLGFLGYFKYADFFIENINAATNLSIPLLKVALPIGISFYTFQLISYNIDVYRGDVPAQKNLVDLATYISLFPQLIAGPIVRYSDVAIQLRERTHSLQKAATGVRRFVIGLSKKVLIANVLGEICETFKASNDKSVLFFWIYAVAFCLHVYFDFSGYSDMAIGLGKMFGFDFLENFNYPYISKSITEFWRRWHMSLGSWFRDYVYIPLGGSRVGKLRLLFNILVVWMLTGFWHGADWNFIVWGLYFAVILILEKQFLLPVLKKTGRFQHIYVLLLIIISFVIFNAADMGEAMKYISCMFGGGGIPLLSAETGYYFRSNMIILFISVIGATPVIKNIAKRLEQSKNGTVIIGILEPIVLIMLLLLCTAYLVDGSFNPFLYFRF